MSEQLSWRDKCAIACATLVLALLMAGGLGVVALAVFLGRVDWRLICALLLFAVCGLTLLLRGLT